MFTGAHQEVTPNVKSMGLCVAIWEDGHAGTTHEVKKVAGRALPEQGRSAANSGAPAKQGQRADVGSKPP